MSCRGWEWVFSSPHWYDCDAEVITKTNYFKDAMPNHFTARVLIQLSVTDTTFRPQLVNNATDEIKWFPRHLIEPC